jgi:hypothetical protein
MFFMFFYVFLCFLFFERHSFFLFVFLFVFWSQVPLSSGNFLFHFPCHDSSETSARQLQSGKDRKRNPAKNKKRKNSGWNNGRKSLTTC